jgi:flagellar hook assembly protein FlgD
VYFRYHLKTSAAVTLKIYRLTGELVAEVKSNSMQPAGENTLYWDGTNINRQTLPNGLYLVMVKIRGSDGLEQDGLNHPKFIEILK